MTIKEFWHLKYGDVVEDTLRQRILTVFKRQVYDECCGFLLTKTHTYDFKTGRKLLEITFCGNDGYNYYYQSEFDKVKNLILMNK